MNQIQYIITFVQTNWVSILALLAAINGVLAAIVKICPTLPANHWLLPIIKWLGKLTNNQTDDAANRAASK